MGTSVHIPHAHLGSVGACPSLLGGGARSHARSRLFSAGPEAGATQDSEPLSLVLHISGLEWKPRPLFSAKLSGTPAPGDKERVGCTRKDSQRMK